MLEVGLIELGNVHRFSKEPQVAVECYERCAQILSSNESDHALLSDLFIALGHAKLSMKETAEASKCFDTALIS
jgi:Tetratricopeptide repeat